MSSEGLQSDQGEVSDMRFNYLEPKTIEEAVSLLSKYGRKAKVIAGGTDLLMQIRNKTIKPEYVVDLGGISRLDYIGYENERSLLIGALTTIRALERSVELQRRYTIISQAAGQLGSVAIRNVATIGGNLCNAAPSAEIVPALIGLSAKAKIVGPDGERIVAVEDLFTSPGQTVLTSGELLVEIQVPTPPPNTKGVYLKHAIRGSIDLAILGVAAIVTLNGNVCCDVKIALGGVAPTPMRARKAEEVLKGETIDATLIQKAAKVVSAESNPITDVRASAEYRREMLEVFTRRAIDAAITK